VADVPFEVRLSELDDAIVVAVFGEIDMVTAPELEQGVAGVPSATRRVVVDLEHVTFLDSSGLNTLVRCSRELARRSIEFRLVSPAERAVRRVFEITALDGRLRLADTLAQALAD
jgi:stage II sporulation protein AA (anti-sigma F factor antagonist)